jgi:hypothetical protein
VSLYSSRSCAGKSKGSLVGEVGFGAFTAGTLIAVPRA